MAKCETKCGVNLIKCGKGGLSVHESHFDNFIVKSYSTSKAQVVRELKEISERVNYDKLQVCDSSEFEGDIIVKEEDSVEDELHPITFVAVSPVSPKSEELNNQQNVSCARDPLLPNPPEEDPLNSDMTSEINFKKEREFLSDWEVKLEVKEDMLAVENNSSIYSEDVFVEAHFEAVCDVSTSDVKDEKPVDTKLNVGNFDSAKRELWSIGRSEVLTSGAKESSLIGYQQEINQELGVGYVDQVERKEAPVIMDMNSSSNKVEEAGNCIIAFDKTYGPSKSGRKPKEKMLNKISGKYQSSFICPRCGAFFSSKIMYNRNFFSYLGIQVCVCPLKTDLQESKPNHGSAMNKISWNIGKESLNSSEQLERSGGTVIQKPSLSCFICQKSFSEKIMLDAHVQTHKGKKLFVCGICEKSFIFQCTLDKHMRTHAVENPYKCYICKNAYSCKSKLNMHMRSHAVRKPLACAICKKLFFEKSTLNAHMRTHAANKP